MPADQNAGPNSQEWDLIRQSMLLVWFVVLILIVRTSTGSTLDIALLVLALSVMGSLIFPGSKKHPIDASMFPALSDRCREVARDPRRKIEAIKIYREETGLGLRDAKLAVEAFLAAESKPPSA